jgi:hypothetical protein
MSGFLTAEISFKIFSDTNKCNIIYKCNKGRLYYLQFVVDSSVVESKT